MLRIMSRIFGKDGPRHGAEGRETPQWVLQRKPGHPGSPKTAVCAERDAFVLVDFADQRTEQPAKVLVKIGDHAVAFRGTPEALWLRPFPDRLELVIDEAGVWFRHYLEEYTVAPSKFKNRAEQRMFLKVLKEGLFHQASMGRDGITRPIVPVFTKNFRKKLRSGAYIGG